MQKNYLFQALKKLANLQIAISLLFLIGIMIALGTFIEQNQNLLFYQTNYPEDNPIFGIIEWKLIKYFQLDNIYVSPGFIILLVLFGLSLLTCTFSIQLPSLQKFRRWKFFVNINKEGTISKTLPLYTSNISNYYFHTVKYNIFKQGKKNYAYTGLLGRIGPIVVHGSMILLMLGSTVTSLSSYTVQELVPRGEIIHVQNFVNLGALSKVPQNIAWRVNDFWITYTETLRTNQFYSDLSLLDQSGNELKRKTIFVNEPFLSNGLTVYQTDWDILGLKAIKNGSQRFQMPLKKITQSGKKIWFGSLNASFSPSTPLTILLNDLTGSIYIYQKGVLFTQCQIGEIVNLPNDESIIFSDYLVNTGLQIKADPGIKIIYLSFFFLMLSTYVSFLTYSEIWTTEISEKVILAGKSNRAVLFFQSEFLKVFNKICSCC
jgi:cytochrome c biogenesis protein